MIVALIINIGKQTLLHFCYNGVPTIVGRKSGVAKNLLENFPVVHLALFKSSIIIRYLK